MKLKHLFPFSSKANFPEIAMHARNAFQGGLFWLGLGQQTLETGTKGTVNVTGH